MGPTHRASEGSPDAPADMQPSPVLDDNSSVAALRAHGGERLDPVRLRYIEALARRVTQHQGEARRLLDRRLSDAVTAYAKRLAQMRAASAAAMPALEQRHPQAAAYLRRLHAEGDFTALRRRVVRLDAAPRRGPLAELVHTLNRQAVAPMSGRAKVVDAEALDAAASTQVSAPVELKTLRNHRDTWTRLRVDAQLVQSQQKIPENPGPLNSHLLVQRSLQRMRELSPGYLAHFMAHVEALMWLDQAGWRDGAAPAKTTRPAPARKRVGRSRGTAG